MDGPDFAGTLIFVGHQLPAYSRSRRRIPSQRSSLTNSNGSGASLGNIETARTTQRLRETKSQLSSPTGKTFVRQGSVLLLPSIRSTNIIPTPLCPWACRTFNNLLYKKPRPRGPGEKPKIDKYIATLEDSPAYWVAMILHPGLKKRWIEKHLSEEHAQRII
ncbi:hypothetical protein N657DRAFT_111 [Parathielavia appendiculata]|uniref:Uncharacterized protein n=1 Tax=Parathielavia appendiculata TaxID=2587402 RepID=A0AAN6U8V3_9PEZI|nr:hypothetical protein N657DRAFT_111 [Parathielavia appendiculata]